MGHPVPPGNPPARGPVATSAQPRIQPTKILRSVVSSRFRRGDAGAGSPSGSESRREVRMRRYVIWMLAVGAAVTGASCGDSPTVIPSPAPPTTTLPTQPPPRPRLHRHRAPSSARTARSLPGPVARFAISPRELRTDGAQADVYVRARSSWDEVVCLDRTKSHRLDFNANQRNEAGRECCFEGDVTWRVVDDPTGSSSAAARATSAA